MICPSVAINIGSKHPTKSELLNTTQHVWLYVPFATVMLLVPKRSGCEYLLSFPPRRPTMSRYSDQEWMNFYVSSRLGMNNDTTVANVPARAKRIYPHVVLMPNYQRIMFSPYLFQWSVTLCIHILILLYMLCLQNYRIDMVIGISKRYFGIFVVQFT